MDLKMRLSKGIPKSKSGGIPAVLKKLESASHHIMTIANLVLMGILLFTIFIVMIFPHPIQRTLYQVSITCILIAAFFCINMRRRRYMRWIFIAVIIIQWAYQLTGDVVMNGFSKSSTICLFVVIAIWLVKQAAYSKTVTRIVILESVNGYLMIGMLYSIVIALVILLDPSAYHFQDPITGSAGLLTHFDECLYYGFSALTTVTYGDVLPISPVAKSLSAAMGLTGQMYVAVIIAMLVGKYAGRNKELDKK